MFAIIETLGRQYKVSIGDRIKVDHIPAETGAVTFNQVLFVGSNDGETIKIGTPVLSGATVTGKIVEQGKEKKVIAFKKKRRKGYMRKVGSRRMFTVVEIDNIKAA